MIYFINNINIYQRCTILLEGPGLHDLAKSPISDYHDNTVTIVAVTNLANLNQLFTQTEKPWFLPCDERMQFAVSREMRHVDFRNDVFEFQWIEMTVEWRLTCFMTLVKLPFLFYQLFNAFRSCF